MRQLTKGMYADLSCKDFGISYGQHRSDEVIRNAGWFNDRGEKLGYGDLSLGDLDLICAELRDNEYFIVLNEADTIWDMPKDLEKISPGIQYVMDHAIWVCTNADLFKVCTPRGGQDKYYEGVGNYYEIKREVLFEQLKFESGKFNSKAGIQVNEVIPGNFYGLDEYVLSNGEHWAVGAKEDITKAAKARAGATLHKFGSRYMSKIIPIRQTEADAIQSLIDVLGEESEYLLVRLLGEDKSEYLEYLAKNFQYDIFGTDVMFSEDVAGLPIGFRAISLTAYRL